MHRLLARLRQSTAASLAPLHVQWTCSRHGMDPLNPARRSHSSKAQDLVVSGSLNRSALRLQQPHFPAGALPVAAAAFRRKDNISQSMVATDTIISHAGNPSNCVLYPSLTVCAATAGVALTNVLIVCACTCAHVRPYLYPVRVLQAQSGREAQRHCTLFSVSTCKTIHLNVHILLFWRCIVRTTHLCSNLTQARACCPNKLADHALATRAAPVRAATQRFTGALALLV